MFPQEAFYSSILETNDGTILTGTLRNGLYYYNPKKNIYGKIKIYKNHKDLLTENRIDYLYESLDHHLWIATEYGLYKTNFDTKKVEIFTTDTGLPSNLIYTLIQDSLRRIWVTTSKGLVLLNENGNILQSFTKNNGLLGDQFNYSSIFKDKDNYIYAGDMKGMIRFNPSEVKDDNFNPSVYITNISVFNTSLAIDKNNGPLFQSLTTTDEITLPHNKSTLSIDFAALSFESADNIQYAYQLEGLDQDCNYIKKKHSVYFTNLPYGNYIFKVRTTNNSGIWQKNERKLRINILPPIWKTTWAHTLYIALFFASLTSTIVYYKKRLIKKHTRKMELYSIQKNQELAKAKIDFFTTVVHEIRTPLTLIKAPLEKIINQIILYPTIQKYILTIERNTERLILLSDELLNFQKTEINNFKLKLEAMDIAPILRNIINLFEEIAQTKNINIHFSSQQNQVITYIDEEAFTKIVSNLINNAIKYAENEIFVELSSNLNNKNINIRFKNDGKKISPEMSEKIFEPFFRLDSAKKQPGIGIGLALSRSLAILHNGTLTFEASDDQFNIFVLTLPKA